MFFRVAFDQDLLSWHHFRRHLAFTSTDRLNKFESPMLDYRPISCSSVWLSTKIYCLGTTLRHLAFTSRDRLNKFESPMLDYRPISCSSVWLSTKIYCLGTTLDDI
ncbi:hypothetical protein AVEN_248026-1 [Araneus ventricosus]|uniref:Uncharacterized protein n=1 Tax=Araneus ventricosus TaxID=182803 RepID=A0A4Y2JIV3_ARAVE|nr:hypothetical protein AVEN_248026-1 [Araneus ventricosus]